MAKEVKLFFYFQTDGSLFNIKTLRTLITDGPYIFLRDNAAEVAYVVQKAAPTRIEIVKDEIDKYELNDHLFTCWIDNHKEIADFESFKFGMSFAPLEPVSANYEQPEKVLVMSDVEGNFYSLQSLLIAQNVMDINGNWTFGKNHFVILGDLIDRSYNVLPCLWLIYKLDMQARQSGGVVHYILGNHEFMNFDLDYRYIHSKYKYPSHVHKLYLQCFDSASIIAQWMSLKNTIEKIGSYLFVHAGVSKTIVENDCSLLEINYIVRNNLIRKDRKSFTNRERLVLGSDGPLWYRGMMQQDEYPNAETQQTIEDTLQYFNAQKMIIGHTIVSAYTKLYNGKVIAIDIHQPVRKGTSNVTALLIEGSTEYVVDDQGNKTTAFDVM